MKKLFTFLAACLILALPASSAVYKKTLISETFALCTQGSIETPTTENIYDAATGEIFSQYLTTPGWHFVTQTGEVSTNALTQAGGVAYVESSYNAMLQSPTLKWGGSTDGQVTVTFDALPVGETTSIRFDLRTSASGKKQVAAEFTAGEWSTVSVTHSISGDEGTIRLNGGEAFYIRNLVVTINAEAPDLSGTFDFASTVSVVNEGTWSDLAVANFTFDVEANTGEDAEQYPYIVKNFLPFNMATGNAPHDLKAFYGPDGNLVIQGGCNAAHYLYGESNEQYHLCLFDGKGYAGGNGQIALSKTAEGYTVADGITAVRHSKYDWGFMSDDTPIDLVRYSDIAITRPKVADYDEFVGTYNITGTRNAESLVDLSRPKGWKVLDGEGTFDIELNTGDDAEQFPLILKGFLGTPDFTVNDLKARVVNGQISIPQGKNISLQGSSPRAFLCTTTEETSTYTATEDDIVFTADAEGKLVPTATVAVGYHEDGISFFGIPDDDRVAYIYSSLVISKIKQPEPADFVGDYTVTATRNAESLVDLSRPKGWKVLDGEGTLTIALNEGEDAEQFPLILKGFLGTPDFAVNDLKARVVNGQLSVPQGKNISLQGSSPRAFLCTTTEETSTYTATEDDIVFTADAEGKLVPTATVAVGYHEDGISFFGIPDDDRVAYIYSSLVISKIKQPEPADFVGDYTVTATRNAESLVDLSRPKGWKVLDGEGTLTIALNEGEDAEQFPLILKGFLGTPDFAVNDLKARVVNGQLSVPQGKNISLQGSSPRAFLCTTTEETSTYTATEDDIIFTADAEGKLVPNATVAVGYHEDGISFLGIPDDDRVAYIYSSLVIAPKTSPEVEPNTTTMYFTAPELRDEVANIGQALIGVLNVTTTADKYVTETLRSSEASADGTLAGVRAPQEEEVFEVLAVEGGYVLRHHNAAEGEGYLGLNGNTFTAADQAGATVWTILGPDEEGYGSVTSFDDIYPDIAAELNPNMVRFITQGQYLNGQNFENIGGIRGGTGAWSFNYVRNANYVEVVDYRPALAEAIAAGEEALAAHELSEPLVTIKSDGLITTADQFSSDFSDSAEGTDFGALIDEEPSTFWHSDWHDAAPEGPHSFDVNIPENTFTSFDVIYAGRFGANNCSPIVMTVYGKNEGGEWETITTLTQEDGLGAYAGQGHSKNIEDIVGEFVFSTTKVYTDFRFEAHAIWADAGVWTDLEDFEMPEGAKVNEERCFNYSEFQMYGAELKKYDIEEELALALEAAVAEGKTLYNDETVADTDAQLQTATEAINAALKAVEEAEVIVFDYVIRIVGAEDGAAIIGGEEWYDGEELTTVYAKVTAEDVTALEVEGYEATVTVEDGVITVTYTLATGIDGLATDAQRAAIFNIQGQRLNAVGRGVNVVGGKKVLVK
ncbi:MAG: hypothetical protein MJZ54_04150 [Bacteroidaceae bacterium]|nr:hypothetical protein [Bacteroidaceae bacterium]